MLKVNNDVSSIVKVLSTGGFTAYLVGGAVRDYVMGKSAEIVDFDIVTSAMPAEIDELFLSLEMKVRYVGESFKVHLINGVEVATYRCNCGDMSIEQDLFSRDLTINAMAINLINNELIDVWGGKNDVQDRVIHFVDSDRTIQSDPLRMLRACRFLAKLEGTFSPSTLLDIQQNAHLIEDVSPERVRIEFLKAMELKIPSLFFSAMYISGLLQYILPEMSKAVEQYHGKWHTENVWEHLLLTGDNLSRKFPFLRLSGYLHDIGKPLVKEKGTNRINLMLQNDVTFIDHESVGSDVVQSFLKKYKFSEKESLFVTGIIRVHMRTIASDSTLKTLRRLHRMFIENGITVSDFIRHKIADRKSNLKREKLSFAEIRAYVDLLAKSTEPLAPFNPHDLAISGGELIAELDLPRDKTVSMIQKHLLQFVLDSSSSVREVNTYDVLLNEATLYYQQQLSK